MEQKKDKESKGAVKDAKKGAKKENDKETNLSSQNPLKEATEYAMELYLKNR